MSDEALVDVLVEAAARLMVTTPQAVLGETRRQAESSARFAIWLVLRERGLTLEAIGALFGRNYSTVSWGISRGRAMSRVDAEFEGLVAELRRLTSRVTAGAHIEDRARAALRSMEEEIARSEQIAVELGAHINSLRTAHRRLADFMAEAGPVTLGDDYRLRRRTA